MKKKIILILSIIAIALLTVGGITWANEYTQRQALEKSTGDDPVMTNGIIRWETEGKKATSGIYYRTVGWNVHKTFVADGNITKSGQKRGAMIMQQVGQTPTTDGQVKTFYRVGKEDVDWALNQISLEWKQGETIYLSAITEVRQGTYDNYKVLGTYHDLQKLKNSQPWSRPDDFDQYFNRKIKLDFQPTKIVEVHLINGKEVNRIDRGTKMPGETHHTTIAKSIDFGGVSAELVRSYYEPFSRRGSKLNPKGAEATERNDIVPPDDGMTVYIEYEMPFPFTVQHVNLDTGKILESEVKTIEDLQTIIVEAKSFEGLNYVYSNVSIDGGQTWKNRSDKTSRSVKRKGGDLIIDGIMARSQDESQASMMMLEDETPQEEVTERDPYEVNVLHSEKTPNEVELEVTTVNGEVLFDLSEIIMNIEKDNLTVTEIHY